MAWLGNIASTVIRNIMFADVPPNQILQISNSEYHKRHVHCREDGIVIYNPNYPETEKYEIVLHRPCTQTLDQCFSLFRSNNIEEVESRFIIYKDVVPVLVEICPSISNDKKIQNICDALLEHPTWNIAHISAHLLLYEAFNHSQVKNYINTHDQQTGASPLQIAIETNNVKMVQQLIAANSSLEHLDFDQNTIYHYAANTTTEMILALKPDNVDITNIVNRRNKGGYTPLHIACLYDQLECVRALINIGANVNTSAPTGSFHTEVMSDFLLMHSNGLKYEEMRLGGTALHCCSSIEVMNEIIETISNIDALNFHGRTALHIMVIRKMFPCVAALLSHLANVNVSDQDGSTPLHLGVVTATPEIVQLLIAFGADVNKQNNKSQTPRHLVTGDTPESHRILYLLHAVGAERCPQTMTGCHNGCKYGESFDGIAPPDTPTAVPRTALDQMLYVAGMVKLANMPKGCGKGGRLLCLDGGGIRGLVLVQTLLEIEAVLQKPITSCFDWIAGTSTGGILTLGLLAGKSLKECQALYFKIKNNAFVGSRPYPSEPLEKALQDCVGINTTMFDIRNPKVMITAALANRRPVDLHIFRNYKSPSQILDIPPSDNFLKTTPPEEELMWKAARATGAAPSYFRAFGPYLDGGLIANNPTLDAMTEIHEYNLALEATHRSGEVIPLSLVVSLGTGMPPVTPQNIDVYRPYNIVETARLALGITSLFNLVVDQATCTDGRVVDRARTWCSMIGVPYFRFNPQLSTEIAMNEKSDTELAEMMWTAKAFMYANRDQIKELACVLNAISEDN